MYLKNALGTLKLMQPRQARSSSPPRPAPTPARNHEPRPEKPVDFYFSLPGAKSAAVAGTFNEWDLNRTPLTKDPSGGWKATVWLAPGRYEYRFVVDGAQWFSDPRATEAVPNNFGSTNSVLVV
jgi:1,4-alpha-glucan branching enzyme